jgi:hypothetical protein
VRVSKPALAALAAAILSAGVAMAQPAPWETDILPPAPAWRGKSEKLIAKPSDPWITPSETTGLTATPSYAETRAWLERLDAASPLIRMESFGKSAQGRDLLVVLVSKDGERFDPAKPVILFQAGIHSGEIDGKDAGLMLLRDIAFRGKDRLLDRVNLVFVPMFSADAHERSGPYNRPNQRGPVNQGWRTTAQNLNLNRDYAKADSPEMRAMLGLLRRFDPDLYVDLHVTDGVDYQYDITYGFEGSGADPARSPAIAAWLKSTLQPAVDKGLKAQGHIPGPLIFAVDDRNLDAGLFAGASTPRFSTGYGDAVGVPTVLVENHSLKPYRQRVLGTYVLMEEMAKVVGAEGASLRAAVRQARATRPKSVPVRYVPDPTPRFETEFLPIERETYESLASGRREVRWLGRPGKPIRLKVFGSSPKAELTPAAAYWVPATHPEIIERLRAHGVEMQVLDAPRTVSVDMIRLKGARPGPASEGHVTVAAEGYAHERRQGTFPAGSVRVPTDQRLGQLVTLLLEPESDDSFFAWGFFPEILQRTEYIEGYAIAPLADRMLAADPKLKAEFEAKLAAEPAFAADPDARLSWFYERTPYYDHRYLLYPVGREAAP